MPTYVYKCPSCELEFDVTKKMSESSTPENCLDCKDVVCDKIPAMPQVLFKGDEWGDKNSRIKKQMEARRSKATVKQDEMKRDAPGVTLVPNVNGERVDSWTDAQKLAKSMGKNTESYNNLVQKEQSNK